MKIPEFGLLGWHIDKGQACDQFYDRRLRIKRGDPGFWEFASDVGGDYIQSIMSFERKEEKDKFGRTVHLWGSIDREHEHIADIEIYGEAAAAYYQFALTEPPVEKVARPAVSVKRRDGRDWWQR